MKNRLKNMKNNEIIMTHHGASQTVKREWFTPDLKIKGRPTP